MKVVKPMLADNKPWNDDKVAANLPLFGSAKLDGIRCLAVDGHAQSRSGKMLPNEFLQKRFAELGDVLKGMDGELILGELDAEDCYKKTHSAVMSAAGVPDLTYWVFDLWDCGDMPWNMRHSILQEKVAALQDFGILWVKTLPQKRLTSMQDVQAFASQMFALGYEGSIFRNPDRPYKNGRGTTTSGHLYKLKAWVDTEVEITGFEELLRNGNEAAVSELGYTVRSDHQENKIPGDTLGAFVCKGQFDDGRPYEVRVGTFKGWSKPELKQIWDDRNAYLGKTIKIKYLATGTMDAPRHPVFLGFRDPIDQ